MKDFAKSIRTGNEYKPGSYDPKRHEFNLWRLDNEISKWSRTVSTLKQQIASLERMVSSGEYSKLTNEELKRAKRDQEAAYMRLKQALSMKKRATGNASFKDVIWTVEDEDGSGSDFQSEAIAYATARKWARESGEPVNIFKTELDENGRPKGQPKFVKTVNKSKVGNESNTVEEAKTKDEYFKILKFYQIQGYKTKAGEYNPNGRIKLHKGNDSVEIVLVGNSKVGNADIYSGNYIIMSDDGNVWFRDEHDDVSIKNIDSWSNERIRQYQASIDEIKKGVQEAKQAAKKYGLL